MVNYSSIEKYKQLSSQYVNRLQNIINDIDFVAIKWDYTDYLYPFSDLDFRVVLNDNEVDFFQINKKLFDTQIELQAETINNQRIFEHPPGFIFFKKEIEQIYIEDFRTWCYAGGKLSDFERFKFLLSKQSTFDENFYLKIIAKRFKKFSFATEYASFSKKNMIDYHAYCILWHYYFPCIFALASLNAKKSVCRKVDSNRIQDKYIKNIFDLLVGKRKVSHLNEADLIAAVDTDVENRFDNTKFKMISSARKPNVYETLAMLRCRLARLYLYLSEDGVDRRYLAEREINELGLIFGTISYYYASDIVNEANSIINSCDSALDVLRNLLIHMLSNKHYYNSIMNCSIGFFL